MNWSSSGDAFKGLAGEGCDVGMSSRAAKPAEEEGIRGVAIGWDAIVILASEDSPLAGVSTGELATRYGEGQIPGHALFSREPESGTSSSLTDLLGLKTLKSDETVTAGDMLARLVSQTPSLGYASAQELIGRTERIRALPVRSDTSKRAHQASPRAMMRNQYPLTRKVYLYRHADEREALVLDFVEFARDEATVAVFDALNMVQASARPEEPATFPLRDCANPGVVETFTGVKVGMFQYPAGKTDASIFERATFEEIVAEARDNDRTLLAVGYSSDDGDPRNCTIANDRAVHTQEQLQALPGAPEVSVIAAGPTRVWGTDPADNRVVLVCAVD